MESQLLPLWVEYARALGTPCAAIIAAMLTGYFAWRQARTAHQQAVTSRNKLKLDLFERRVDVVKGIEQAIFASARGQWSDASSDRLEQAMTYAQWLFDEDFNDYLMGVYGLIHRNQRGILGNTDEEDEGADELDAKKLQTQLFELMAQRDELNRRAADFLTLAH